MDILANIIIIIIINNNNNNNSVGAYSTMS